MGRPRGDEDVLSRKRARLGRSQQPLRGGGYLDGFRHPADPGLASFGHFASVGSDQGKAIALQLRDVAAGRGIGPHQRVHRRRQQDRPVGREQNGAGEIVGMTSCHLRHQVRSRRSYQDQIAITRQADMAGVELAFRIEQICVAALVRQRAGGKRRHELLRGFG